MFQTSGARPCRLLRPKARRRMVVWRPFGFCAGILVLWDGFTFSDFVDQSVKGLVGAVCQLVVEGLVSHVLAEDSGIGCQARHDHANKIVDFEEFLLVFSEFIGQSFQAAEDNVFFGPESETD